MYWSKVWDRILPTKCAVCGQLPSPCCSGCEPTARPFKVTRGDTSVAVAAQLNPAISTLITEFKDKGQLALANSLTQLCSAALELELRGLQFESGAETASLAIAWVPSSRAAQRRRGFDANGHLLRKTMQWRKREGLAIFPLVSTLRHVARNRDQSGLSREERFTNASGSFVAIGRPRRLLLFDDILTTGATLGSALSALQLANFQVAGCFALAETPLRATSVGASRIGQVG